MVAPLAHIHYFSEQSTKIMLNQSGFEILFIKDFSYVEGRRLIKNILKLPLFFLKDLINLEFKNIINRLIEAFLNILDLIKGDQFKVVAKKL